MHALALQFLSSRYAYHCSPHFQDTDSASATATATVGDDHGGDGTLNTVEGAVLWISCTPIAERQIMMGLRKALQHNLGGGGGEVGNSGIGKGRSSSSVFGQGGIGTSSCGPIHIISIPQELADAALLHHDKNPFSHEMYLKGLHRRIVHWLKQREFLRMEQLEQQKLNLDEDHTTLGPRLIIIDNVTTLGTMVGDTLANVFVSSVRSSIQKLSNTRSLLTSSDTATLETTHNSTLITTVNLFVIRSSSPDDGGLYNLGANDNSMEGQKHLRSEYSRLLRPWLGYGSGISNNVDGDRTTSIAQLEEQCNFFSLSPDSVPSFLYRSGLYEVADGIVDVSPLQSGYARDVLGRMAFVPTWCGQGWWGKGREGNALTNKEGIDGTYASLGVNYRCDESGVRIMRLRSR